MSIDIRLNANGFLLLVLALLLALYQPLGVRAAGSADSRFSDQPDPYLDDTSLPKRTPPILELGDPFLGTGNLGRGFTLPTGAVWQPRFWVYGSARSAVQNYDRGTGGDTTEWVNRLNLFGNLQLTGTERVLIGVEPLHRGGDFSGYILDSPRGDGGDEELNFRLRTLFIEGDIGEIFPSLDREDFGSGDWGFALGRQQLFFQDGFLVNDTIDAVGITRNSVRFEGVPWITNLRTTFVFAPGEVNRHDNRKQSGADLYGLFTAIDTFFGTFNSTVELDIGYTDAPSSTNDDLIAIGLGAIQRIGLFSTSLRVNYSIATQRKTANADDGLLIFGELSWTPAHTLDIVYINAFWGEDQFRSLSRDALTGGPLGRTGILFAARGIGGFPSPLSNQADEAAGIAIGYQFLPGGYASRRQLILEIGAREDDSFGSSDAVGIAARFQQAFGRRTVFQVDGFYAGNDGASDGHGIRTEVLVKF